MEVFLIRRQPNRFDDALHPFARSNRKRSLAVEFVLAIRG